jgi:hypothetical protein
LGGLLVEKRQLSGDLGAEHLAAVARLAAVPKATDDEDNVVELKQA